jgi:apolipoprotein N-acyltransferase
MAPAPLVNRWWGLALAVASGLLLVVSFPPIGQWWAAPIGMGVLAVAVHRRGLRYGALLGLISGLVLMVALLQWAGGYIGPVWLFLPAGESVFFALLGAVSAVSSPLVDRWRWTWPVATRSIWVLQEALRDRAPFGGFPWGRIAFSQADSPLLRLAALGGAPLVTFGVGAVGGLLALTAITLSERRARPRLRSAAVSLAVAALVMAVPLAVPIGGTGGGAGGDRTVRVAIVQGNVPRLGLEFNAQRRAVLDNHVNATLELAADVKAGRAQQPDMVVWPENSSDIDPLANPDATARIDLAAQAIGAPILVGGLLEGPGAYVRNVGLVWQPSGEVTQTYVKRHPVPFAEYIPIRSFARKISAKVDLVSHDFMAGPTPGVLRLGPATVGDVICFEVAYDNVVRDTVTGGAQLLVVQTNNASFNRAEALQQLAMVRLRAVEHGRPALMASTVGVSAFVDESGTVYDPTQFNTKAVIAKDVALSSTRTIATKLGIGPELALCVAAIAALAAAAVLKRQRRRVEV